MHKIRAGIIGIGFIGALHAESLRRLGFVEVAGIADVCGAKEKAERLCIRNAYKDYRELIEKEKPDVIHICTPNDLHYEIAVYAMERGIHVVCEKPMAVSSEQARHMKEIAGNKGLVCSVNFSNRFHPMVMQMKEMAAAGTVGKIYTVHGSYLQDWLYYDTDYSWRLDSARSGKSRAFADIGSHWLDAVENIIGQRAVSVLADLQTFHPVRKRPPENIRTFSGAALRTAAYDNVAVDTEDYAGILFHFSEGAVGSCCISQVYAGRKNQMVISVGGSQCALHWDSESSDVLWIGRRESYNQSAVKDPALLSPKARAVSSYPGGHAEGFADTFKHSFNCIYTAIQENRTEGEFASFEDGLHETILCEKIIQSAAEGRWISVE